MPSLRAKLSNPDRSLLGKSTWIASLRSQRQPINLLPWRRDAYVRRMHQMLGGIVCVLGAMIAVCAVMRMYMAEQIRQEVRALQHIHHLQQVNAPLQRDRDRLQRGHREMLKKLNHYQTIASQQIGLLHLFTALMSDVPDHIVLTRIARVGSLITLQGVARRSSQVSLVMRTLLKRDKHSAPVLLTMHRMREKEGYRFCLQYHMEI